MNTFKEKYGSWVLITGASSGIGAEFARQLAAKKLNLVLVARRKDRLEKLAGELSERYSIETKAVSADLLDTNFSELLKKATEGIEIGLVVSNAGMMRMGEYFDISLEEELKIIDLNVKAPAILTRLFGEKMVQRGRGGIIFVASTLGYMGTPYSAVYAASKAYEIIKSESLWYELKPKGVDVMVLNPGLTDTEMSAPHDFSHMPMKLMQPKDVVDAALKGLGKKSQVIPGKMNQMMGWMTKRIMSRDGATKMIGDMMKKSVEKAQRI